VGATQAVLIGAAVAQHRVLNLQILPLLTIISLSFAIGAPEK